MWGWMQDLRYALRMLRQSPGLTAVAALSLALGIGANTAIFSLMDAVLLRMLPVERPAELERIDFVFSYPIFRELRQRNHVFSGMFGRHAVPVSLVSAVRTEPGVAELVSGNYFSVLGVHPTLGRTLTDGDDQAPMAHPVAVLSYNYWRRRLTADPAIVGKTVRINGYPFTIAGVGPPGFLGVEVGSAPDVWVPMMMQPLIFGMGRQAFDQVNWGWMTVMGRRAPGISETQAQAALNVSFQQIIQELAGAQKFTGRAGVSIRLEPGGKGLSRLRSQFENPLYVLMAMVALVLLIACANIANLLLARSAARRREIAVRLALGAGRMRLVRQLLTESTLLGILGGALGICFSAWGVRLLLTFLPVSRLPLSLEAQVDGRVLAFAMATSILTGLLFGLAPAIQATRPDLTSSLKNEGTAFNPGSRRFELRKILVVSQMALSLLLLVGASLFLRTLRNAAAIDLGLNTANVLMASVDASLNGYTPVKAAELYRQLEARLRESPGVQAVGASESTLLSGESSQVGMRVPGRADPAGGRSILMNRVGGDFFAATGINFLRGRGFGLQDAPSTGRTAIINETAARDFFGDEDPVGRKVRLGGDNSVEIIGVVRDSRYRSVRETTPRIAYFTFQQDQGAVGARTYYLRTAGDPIGFIAVLRRELQGLDKDLPLYNVKTFLDQKNESLSRERLIATLSGFFGVLALLLASIGLYGVTAYGVLRRTREIGIRMSLGAQRGIILRMILKDCLVMVAAGVAVGLPLSLWLSKIVSSQLFGVAPGDVASIGGAALILTVVAAFAGYLPALRASRVDPMVALRYE